jgi:hypothetical protein
MSPEPHVSEDHSLIATVFQEELKEDMHAPHANQVISPTQLTLTNVSLLHLVTKPIKLDRLSVPRLVEDALLANGQLKFQTRPELLVSQDHSLHAQAVSKDNLMMDTPASTAQLDKLRVLTMPSNATLLNAQDNMLSDSLSMPIHAVLVYNANGQDKFQTKLELLALIDNQLTAQAALPDNLMMDTLANNAHQTWLRIQITSRDATLHNASVSMISDWVSTFKLVEDATPVISQDKFQTSKELLVLTDHSLNAQTA